MEIGLDTFFYLSKQQFIKTNLMSTLDIGVEHENKYVD